MADPLLPTLQSPKIPRRSQVQRRGVLERTGRERHPDDPALEGLRIPARLLDQPQFCAQHRGEIDRIHRLHHRLPER